MHNENDPALICIYTNGDVFEEWYNNGNLHRYSGPAVIRQYTGHFSQYVYYIHGRPVTKSVDIWLEERGYEWEKMTNDEKWELSQFLISLG